MAVVLWKIIAQYSCSDSFFLQVVYIFEFVTPKLGSIKSISILKTTVSKILFVFEFARNTN